MLRHSELRLAKPDWILFCVTDIKKMQMPPGDNSLRVTVFASKLEAWLRFAHLPYRIERSATLKGAPKGQVCCLHGVSHCCWSCLHSASFHSYLQQCCQDLIGIHAQTEVAAVHVVCSGQGYRQEKGIMYEAYYV